MADEKGTLYLCATPIGNLGDVSERLLETLRSVDLIAAEDTRRTLKLLNSFEITKPLTSYHEHNKRAKGEYLVKLLLEGKNIAQVSDAGTPAVSDPGEDLVRLCIENDITVTAVPGAFAGINALILSGLPARRCAFEGFLSVNKRHRREHLKSLKDDTHTLIFYEAPHKLKTTLADMRQAFGGDRRVALARELTKVHEEIIRTTLDGAVKLCEEKTPRGEYVIVIEGAAEQKTDAEPLPDASNIHETVMKYIAEGLSAKDASKAAARDLGLSAREVYNEYHREAKS